MAVDSPTHSSSDAALQDALSHIRASVRAEHPYVVGLPENVHVKLNQNESPFDLPEDLKTEILDALTQVEFNRYPDEQPHALVQAIAEHDGVDPASIIVGNGSNELTYTFGQAFIDPGAPVVLPRPMFSLYEKVARLCDADLTGVPPNDDLSFNAEAIADAAVATGATMTVLTTPNNPTGLAMTMDEIEHVVSASPGIVVVDEAYVEFNPEGTAAGLIADHPNVIVLRTLSKAFGLAGIRLGYLIAHPKMATELMKSRLPFMIDRFSEQVGLSLLKRPDLLDDRVSKMQASTQQIVDGLRTYDAVDVVPSHANFVLFRTPLPSGDLQDQLAEHGVLIRDMSGYPELQNYVRVSAGTESENKAFLAALDQTL